MNKRGFWLVCISLIIAFSLGACKTKNPTPTVVEPVSVTLSLKSAALILGGESVTLTAEVKYNNDTKNNNVKWTSSDEKVVMVENGIVKAISIGNAVVTAASIDKESVSDSCTIEVIAKPEITLNSDAFTILTGKGNINLHATVKHKNGTVDNIVSWSSSAATVATISAAGVVAPIAVGTTEITATVVDAGETLTAKCIITVLADASTLTGGTDSGIVYTLSNSESNAKIGYAITAENKEITGLIIPDSFKGLQVTEIKKEAFRQCTQISTFRFGKNIKIIGANAFTMETEVIPDFDKPTSKDHKALVSSKLRTNLVLNNATEMAENAFADSFFKIVSIPEGIENIPYRAFAGATITSVNFPTSLKSIDSFAFAGCRSLTSALLTHTKVDSIGLSGSDVSAIGNSFLQCGTLETIGTLPATLKIIEYSTFETCTNLKTIVLNEGLVKIGNAAFRQCASITEITIPTTVTKIGEDAFGRWGTDQTINTNVVKANTPNTWHKNWTGAGCNAVIVYKA